MMIELTKLPEQSPVWIKASTIDMVHIDWQGADLCCLVSLRSGASVLVAECMRDIQELMQGADT